jgi:hypothetical protein
MEADWEVEIGPGAPVIAAQWAGFVDLRRTPELAQSLPEVALLPELAETLVRLNRPNSTVWTAKCDFWPLLDSSAWDADEMEASADCAFQACAGYIDLLPASDRIWDSPERAVSWCRQVCSRLRTVSEPCCRLDFVIRRALGVRPAKSASDELEIGISAYLTACGPSSDVANRVLGRAAGRFADALDCHSTIE